MKRCPECRRDYYDDTLLYCLDDGSALLDGPASMDEPATAILSAPRAVAGGLRRPTEESESKTAIFQPPTTTGGSDSSTRRSWAIATVLLLLVTGGISFAVYKFWGKSEKPALSFQTAKFTRLTTTGKASGVAISPDGKYVVHMQDEGGQQSLWMRQVATQSNVQIVAPAAVRYDRLTFSPDGNYIYYSLTSQEFPQRTFFQLPTLGGTPKKMLENNLGRTITISPDGKQFAFTRQTPDKGDSLMIADADGTNERELVFHKLPEDVGFPAWSPDGKRIAYAVQNPESNDANIFEAQVADGSTKPLTAQRWFRMSALAWLADGSSLLMLATPGHGFVNQIWQLSYPQSEALALTNDLNGYTDMSFAADTGALAVVQSQMQAAIWIAPVSDPTRSRPVTSGSGKVDTFSTWTPDGRLVFQSDAAGNNDIWIANADGSGVRQLTDKTGHNGNPEVAPDGTWILFRSNRTGALHNWRMNMDGTDQRQITNTPGGSQGARFSPDGRWIVFRTAFGRWTTWKVPAGGSGEPVQISNKISRSPTVSPDGKLVAYFYREDNGPWRIAVASFEGGEPLKTFDIPDIPDPSLRWTPDGRALAYVDTKNGVSNIVAQPLDGGKPKQLTDFKENRIFSFAYSNDGKQLTLSRGTTSNDVVLISNFLGGKQ